MKLIDMLVQELPKRGGWPEGAWCITVIEYHMGGDLLMEFIFPSIRESNLQGKSYQVIINDVGYIERIMCDDPITKEQYESALAALQKPAWNGGGLPPSGVECEARLRCNDGEWFLFRCVGVDCGVAFGWAGKDAVTLGKGSYEFRPLRSEAERKRDAFINAVLDDMRVIPCDLSLRDEVAVIYDAIAAGKIPGVKLDD